MEFLINKTTNKNVDISKNFFHSEWDSSESYDNFKNLIKSLVDKKESKTFYKFSDGEYFWLTNNQVGSVSPGRRDSNIAQRDLVPFKEGVVKNDYLMCQLLTHHVGWFRGYFNKNFDFPVDYAYASLASGWFTKEFSGNIGIIGADVKMDLISKLCEKSEYKEYLGFNGFSDYIKMPQKFLCDNIDEAEKSMGEQLTNSKSSIFLVGIGHAQQALLHRMKKYKDAVYIVVGSGIDALAGVQDNSRPYMGDWINFKIKDYDYSKIDIWSDYSNIKEI